MTNFRETQADVCLILEGTYPYVSGGLSTWTHELIQQQNHLTFTLVTIMPPDSPEDQKPIYDLPDNVVGLQSVYLQRMPQGKQTEPDAPELFRELNALIMRLQSGAGAQELKQMIEALRPYHGKIGSELLLNSQAAWDMVEHMYESTMPQCSFLDYFWSCRALLGGFYSVLLADIPKASVYHALCTGYAGVYAARAHLETGKPSLLTEHGIYTNERRIEISLADWLYESGPASYSTEKFNRDIRDLWLDTFSSYSRMCYECCEQIITLYAGNQQPQMADGADPRKLSVIHNGINIERYGNLERNTSEEKPPTIALIGRVVPIKDIKTFIRSCAALHQKIPELRAYVMGPTDEDSLYYAECRDMVQHMGLTDTVIFTGKVNIDDYLPEIDVIVLTSISEAQPLVILEAGAAGIPTVATNVGACKEMLLGQEDEEPALGNGGAITPLSNPVATADALYHLLNDREYYRQCSNAIRARVRSQYTSVQQRAAYRDLYEYYLERSGKQAA